MEPNNSTNPESLDSILNEFKEPGEQAVGSQPGATTGDNADTTAVPGGAPDPLAISEQQKFFLPPLPEGGEIPEPIFQVPRSEETPAPIGGSADAEEGRIKKWTKQEMDENLEMFLNLRNLGQAEILAMIAKSKDRERFEMDEEQMNRLARVYRPVMAKYGGKIPDAVWIIGAEAIITIPLVLNAIDERKTNMRNAKLAASHKVRSTVAVATANQPERKNFSIDDEGYYIKDRKNKYLKIGKRTEKASLDDIDRIKEDNDIAVVMAAFPELADAGS